MAYTGIDNSELFFQTKIYNGNGSTNAITLDGSDNMQPDWTWIKNIPLSGGYAHNLFDSVRGTNKKIVTNDGRAETTETNTLNSFDSNGFTLGNDAGTDEVNKSGTTFVSWNWKAGTSVSGNTTGSGSSKSYTGSVSTDAGFSIIRYTGNGTAGHTIPHHLGVQPQVVICKRLSSSGQWVFGSMALPNQFEQFLELDLTGGAQSSSLRWNNTDPSSSVFTVGSTADTNQDGTTIVAYSFANKQGFSRMGSYVGNGDANGTFIYTGFKPAFIMVKNSGASYNWVIQDNKRDPSSFYNPLDRYLYPNSSDPESESSDYNLDFLSNGFKPRNTRSETNDSGNNYIFMAFAENPFTTSTGVAGLAR